MEMRRIFIIFIVLCALGFVGGIRLGFADQETDDAEGLVNQADSDYKRARKKGHDAVDRETKAQNEKEEAEKRAKAAIEEAEKVLDPQKDKDSKQPVRRKNLRKRLEEIKKRLEEAESTGRPRI